VGVFDVHNGSGLDVLRQPANTLAITLSHDDGAHEDLDGPNALEWDLALTGCLVETEFVPQLVLGDGVGVINLVTKDKEGGLGEILHGKKSIKFSLALGESLRVLGIYKEDNTRNLREVVLPQSACLLVTAQVKGCEADRTDAELFRSWVKSGVQDGDSVVLEHVKKRGLSCVVQTQEQEFSMLVQETKIGKGIPEPVDNPHFGVDSG